MYFLILLGAFLIWMAYLDMRSWLDKLKQQKEHDLLDQQQRDIVRPTPWLGMRTSELKDCSWGTYYDSCNETITAKGTDRIYLYTRGGLHFRNGVLITIKNYH